MPKIILQSIYMFCCFKKPWNSAGCFFTDGRYFLAGYQRKKTCISGIGGMKNIGEQPIYTAIRETIEELFDILVPASVILEIIDVIYAKQTVNGSYIMFVLSFDDLDTIISFLHNCNITSNLYDTFPKNVVELVFNRKVCTSEISHLALLPFVKNLKISHEILDDIRIVSSDVENRVEYLQYSSKEL